MRLCLIASGTSLHTKRWANYFAQKGHDVHLISTRFPKGYEGYDDRINMHHLLRLFPRIWKVSGYLSGIVWLLQVRRLVHTIKPDMLDAHYVGVPAYLGVASGFHPIVLTTWGSDILIDTRRSLLRRILTKWALSKADVVMCESEIVREALLDLRTDPVKIKKLYWGVDIRQFSAKLKDEELRVQFGAKEAPIIICTRNLKPVYNVEMLIKTIPLVLEQAPQVKFVIAGEGEQKEHLQKLSNTSGISDNTHFVGWIPRNELPRYLASADIYISTSVSDSTSASLQEAMSCELAPVVTDLPANREWIEDGKNGSIVPVDNIEELADRILRLVKDKELRKAFGEAGRKLIEDKGDQETNLNEMESLYGQLVKKRSGQ